MCVRVRVISGIRNLIDAPRVETLSRRLLPPGTALSSCGVYLAPCGAPEREFTEAVQAARGFGLPVSGGQRID